MNKGVNKELVEYFSKKGQKAKAKRVEECANIISWKVFNNSENTHKLDTINLCRERLCPNCATARARKKAIELFEAFKEDFAKKEIVFVTLTTDNVKGEKLRETVQAIQKALKGFLRSLKCKDYFRSTEITYNEKANTYHPHIHLIMKVENKDRIASKVRETWERELHKVLHTKHPYIITNVNTEPNEKSVLELCKYITKPTEIKQTTIKWLDTLRDLQLKRGSKSVTSKTKSVSNEYKLNEKRETNELLKNFEFSVISYMWNGDNYERA